MAAMMFMVNQQPYCACGETVAEKNREFIDNFDVGYFRFLLKALAPLLGGPDRHRAALALRSAFFHSLETLFTLLGATLQAPHCVVGWIPHCKTGDLRDIVEAVRTHKAIREALGVSIVSWDAISEVVHSIHGEQAGPMPLAKLFGSLWSRLACEFLADHAALEYNSIKHGLRLKPGGTSVAMYTSILAAHSS